MRKKSDISCIDNGKGTRLGQEKDLSDGRKYFIFTVYSLVMILFGFLMDTPMNILKGIYHIIIEPDLLITDYIAIGGIGASFVNAGVVMLATILILKLLKAEFQGITIAAIYLMGGFSLFGKNIFNIWLIILGVALYAKVKKEKLVKHIYVAFFGTSLSPIISEIYFGMDLPLWNKILLSIPVGLSIGFLLAPLANHLFHVHKGHNLYNVGFTTGILGTLYVSLFKSYGYVSQSKLIWSEGNNVVFGIFFSLYFISMLMLGVLVDRKAPARIMRIFRYSGVAGSDFIAMESFGAALFNMGINGLLAMVYILLIKGDLNGPTLGGILTVMSFGACGKHVKNIIPILIGVFLGGITKNWNIHDPQIQLAALFGTGLAPISGHYGWIFGVLAGFINSSVVLNSGILHGGMNLYNTGFSAGIVAAVMIPILEVFRKKRGYGELTKN